MKPFHRTIAHRELEMFLESLEHLTNARWQKEKQEVDIPDRVALEGLRRTTCAVPVADAEVLFRLGARGADEPVCSATVHLFRFLPFELSLFGRSPLDVQGAARERRCRHLPRHRRSISDFIIYSGTAHGGFAKYRLGRDLASPFENHVFEHPDTRWYNIASRLGTRGNFPKNSPQILDFFAGLVSRRLAGRPTPHACRQEVFRRVLRSRDGEPAAGARAQEDQGDHAGFTIRQLADPNTIPIINYGVIGTNRFERFDGAYCLTGYYVNERVVNSVLQDVLASDVRVPIEITTGRPPCRRRAGTLHPDDQVYDVHTLAQYALDSQEIDTVIQAVGQGPAFHPAPGGRHIPVRHPPVCGVRRRVHQPRRSPAVVRHSQQEGGQHEHHCKRMWLR